MNASTLTAGAPPSAAALAAARVRGGDASERAIADWALAAGAEGDWATALDLLGRLDPLGERHRRTSAELAKVAPEQFALKAIPRRLLLPRAARVERLIHETLQAGIPFASAAAAAIIVSAVLGSLGSIPMAVLLLLCFPTAYVFGQQHLHGGYTDPDRAPDPVPGWPALSLGMQGALGVLGFLGLITTLWLFTAGRVYALALVPLALILCAASLFFGHRVPQGRRWSLRYKPVRAELGDAVLIGSFAAPLPLLMLSIIGSPTWGVLVGTAVAWACVARAVGIAVRKEEFLAAAEERLAAPWPG